MEVTQQVLTSVKEFFQLRKRVAKRGIFLQLSDHAVILTRDKVVIVLTCLLYGPKGSKWGQWVRGEVKAGVNHSNEEPSESKATYMYAFLTHDSTLTQPMAMHR